MGKKYRKYFSDPDAEVPKKTRARHEQQPEFGTGTNEESMVRNMPTTEQMDIITPDDQSAMKHTVDPDDYYEIDESEQIEDYNSSTQEEIVPGIPEDPDSYSDTSSCSNFDELDIDALDQDPKSSNFEEFLENDDKFKKIDASLNVSEAEILIAVLEYSLRYSLPNEGIEDLLKLINLFLNTSVVPETQYLIDKLLISENGAKCVAVCSNCKKYLREFKRVEKFVVCEHCNTQNYVKGDDPNFFYFLKTDQEVQNLLEENESYYENVMNENRVGSGYCDIFDGLSYKSFKNSLPIEKRKSFATFVCNSDGANKFLSSSNTIWPIQVQLNEIPAEKRIKNPIVWALWFGKNKPDMKIFMDLFTKRKPVFGVKDHIPLKNLTGFDTVFGQVADDLHLMGVVKQFFEAWFRSSGYPYSVPKHVINEIEEMLKSVKLPTCIGRMLRSLKESKSWKAREWESWLFYVSLPVLREIPGFSDYADHWSLLVDGLYILKKDRITENDFKVAEEKLRKFVALIEGLYSQVEMTFNVHQLEHLLEGVPRWGPLQMHSGYTFETGNGKLKKMIKANKGVLRQICRRIDYSYCARILKKRVAEKLPKSEVLKFCKTLHSNEIKKGFKLSEESQFAYLGKSRAVDKKWIERENLTANSTKSYLRMTKSKCPITSHTKHKKKRNDSIVSTNDGKFVRIEEFLVDEKTKKEVTICRKINTMNTFSSLDSYHRILSIEEEKIPIETESIRRIAAYINYNNKEYLREVPNLLSY